MYSNKLYKKFLYYFIVFVLIPFSSILTYLSVCSNRLQNQSDQTNNKYIALQTVNSVQKQTKLAENICKSVLQNEMLMSFFNKEFNTPLDLDYYTTTIRDFVKITNGVSDVKVRLYLENSSIPLGFGVFYPIDYLKNEPALLSFYKHSHQKSMWINGNYAYTGSSLSAPNSSDYFSLVTKMYSAKKSVGIMIATIPKTAFYISAQENKPPLRPQEVNNFYVYNYSQKQISNQELQNSLSGSSDVLFTKDYVCTKHQLSDFPFKILVITPRTHTNFAKAGIIAAAFIFLFLLTGIFVWFIKHMVRDIHLCLDSMENSIQNGFAPIDTCNENYTSIIRRHDEISSLAQRTQYLLQQIRTLLKQTVQEQTAAKQAQLMALQHQINPHFMYNTMELFSSKMEIAGLYDESAAISAFCRMLRYNINTKELTTLRAELEQVKNFASLQKIRGIPFEFSYSVPTNLLDEPMIRFVIEPFIENSFKYRGNANPLKIEVNVCESSDNNCIHIEIRNNGEMLPKERIEELNKRFQQTSITVESGGDKVGLNNINSRLKIYYGNQHYIRVKSENGWTIFEFPIKKALKNHQLE